MKFPRKKWYSEVQLIVGCWVYMYMYHLYSLTSELLKILYETSVKPKHHYIT